MNRRNFLKTSAGLSLSLAAFSAHGATATKYRVAVIGRTGKGNYGHGLDIVWKQIPQAEIVAVADENEKGRAEAAKRLNAPRAYADYREMLQKEKPQLVSVAPRWLDCHRDMVVACAKAGVRGIMMEKPMARTLAEADEMITACERAHVKTAISHQTRYSPRLERVKEMIAAGKLGDILELRGRGKEDSRGGGEDLMVLGSHIMDLMRLLAGDAKWCMARVFDNGKPVTKAEVRDGNEGIGPLAGDRIDAMYGFASPTVGYFASQRNAGRPTSRFGLRVLGTKGCLDISTGSLPNVFFLDDPRWGAGSKAEWQPVTSAGLNQPEPLPTKGPSDLNPGNVWIAQDLIHAVESNTQPKGSFHDGRAALEMILAVYESHRLGGLAPLPLKNREHPLTLL
ncbi:MAG: Gfo/Idh/MocA family oxidoreductase [Verrucomicrobia bacterium]|nr:Gfo/Idh/MocA family oxidoreductase [Verrucomicrobiota bacterium]